ncbi:MAG: ATP-binding cassette domain-containing protein [Pseudomonadota bacterium]
MIQFRSVSKKYNHSEIFSLQDISLTINQGEIFVLLGSSGSGKSTLLKLINRLIEPTSGQVLLHNKCIKDTPLVQLRRSMGFVFQNGALFPHMTVEDNIAIVLKLESIPLKQRLERTHHLLDFIQLPPNKYAKRYPHQLSGGQLQRVSVARALAADPDCLLMDEPFAALDSLTRDGLQNEVLRLRQEFNKTIVFVTHDLAEAKKLGNRIAVLHQGKLMQQGSFQTLQDRPKTDFVEQLLAA